MKEDIICDFSELDPWLSDEEATSWKEETRSKQEDDQWSDKKSKAKTRKRQGKRRNPG